MRFGGTGADNLIFKANATQAKHIFTGWDFDYLYNFTQAAGWSLIFDLNQLIRNGSNWDPSDAIEFLDYATSKGYSLDFELGNGKWKSCVLKQKFF